MNAIVDLCTQMWLGCSISANFCVSWILCFKSRSHHCINMLALNVSEFPPCTTRPRTNPQELPKDGTAPRTFPKRSEVLQRHRVERPGTYKQQQQPRLRRNKAPGRGKTRAQTCCKIGEVCLLKITVTHLRAHHSDEN